MSRRRGRASSEGAHTCQLGYLGGFEHAAGGVAEALTVEQVEAVARKAESDQEAALIRVAAYTGLRQGELLALPWGDVDLAARKVRVRRPYVRGEYKAPRSVRGSRGG